MMNTVKTMHMRRTTVTIPDDLEEELEDYLGRQEAPPSLTSLVQAALRRFFEQKRLGELEFRPPAGRLGVTPAAEGSGRDDVASRHDAYLSGGE